jgi:hypothetical protein
MVKWTDEKLRAIPPFEFENWPSSCSAASPTYAADARFVKEATSANLHGWRALSVKFLLV